MDTTIVCIQHNEDIDLLIDLFDELGSGVANDDDILRETLNT